MILKIKYMERTIKQRLIDFIYYKRISITTFEKNVGVSNGYVNNINKSIGTDKLEKILNVYPELSCSWLLFGEGEMLKSEKGTTVSANGNGIAVNNSNCKISRVTHENDTNGTLDSLQAENAVLRNENAELRAALLDITRQNQKLTDKLLKMMEE